MRPNIFLGTCEGSTQFKKWYFEVMVDHVEPFLTAQPYHLRVGWALTEGYSPYPGGGEGWGGNGVGDDLYSYSFDGLHLWSGKVNMICHRGSLLYAFDLHQHQPQLKQRLFILKNAYMYVPLFFHAFDLVLLCPYHICLPTQYLQVIEMNSLKFNDYSRYVCPQDVFHDMLPHPVSTFWQQRTWSAAVWI